jgi:hypothetical protein
MYQLRIAEKLSFPINPSDMSPMYSTGTSVTFYLMFGFFATVVVVVWLYFV